MIRSKRSTKCLKRRAAAAALVVISLPVMLGFAVLAVDLGVVYNARGDLQRTADAAALAAIGVVAYADEGEDPLPAATAMAVSYVERNSVLEHTVTIDPATSVIFGRAHYDAVANAYNFVGGELPTNAVRVTVRHTEDSPNGALPLYFAGAFGVSATNITAQSAAMFVDMHYDAADCYDDVPDGQVLLCHYGDSDDSDDSEAGDSDDSDDSEAGDSDGHHGGDPDDSDDSEAGDSDDSDDSGGDSDSGGSDSGDSESAGGGTDSDGPNTILADSAVTIFLFRLGDTVGPCNCLPGDSDDSDDSEAGDSGDSDDSDPGDSDGSYDGDSDDSDDSEAGDSDDSDDSHPGGRDNVDDTDLPAEEQVTLCHIPPGNPDEAHTITVGAPSVPAHLAHGDVLGNCPSTSLRIFLFE